MRSLNSDSLKKVMVVVKNKLSCGICDATFSNVKDRRKHLTTLHNLDEINLTDYLLFPFRCHVCQRVLTTSDIFSEHLELKHGLQHHSGGKPLSDHELKSDVDIESNLTEKGISDVSINSERRSVSLVEALYSDRDHSNLADLQFRRTNNEDEYAW